MKRSTLTLLFVLFAFSGLLVGCATARQRVATAERTYAATARLATKAVNADLVTDPKVLVALKLASDEANESLADANAKVQADAPITSDFYLDRVESALARWVDLLSKAGVK